MVKSPLQCVCFHLGLVIILSLSFGCATQPSSPNKEQEALLREILTKNSNLIEPSSVQIRKLHIDDLSVDEKVESKYYLKWTGELNSKNRMGVYSGWREFAVTYQYVDPLYGFVLIEIGDDSTYIIW